MCGIIGFCGPNDQHTRKLLANLINESTYRGKHSMGICWGDKGGNFALSFGQFSVEDFELWMELAFYGLTHLNVIAHTRYCTSDLDSPMPIINHDKAIVMNGVITQEPFETWPTFGGGPYGSRNDAEIMLRLAGLGRIQETPGSYAACFLDTQGLVVGVRSPERPMWWHSFQWEVDHGVDTAYVFTSTWDAANRADTSKSRKSSRQMLPGVVVCLNNAQEVARWDTAKDLQIKSKTVYPCKL